MSALTMSAPHHHTGFHREFSWQQPRPEPQHRPSHGHGQDRVALPSIRLAFPELQLSAQSETASATSPSATSPSASGRFSNGSMASPEYVHSPDFQKRRRLSIDDERANKRSSRVPRLYDSPQQSVSRQQTPPMNSTASRDGAGFPDRATGYAVRSPTMSDGRDRAESRPTLPSLPLLNFDRSAGDMARMRSHSGAEYPHDSLRRSSLAPNHTGRGVEASQHDYRSTSYGYPYQQPARAQTISHGSVHPFDRTPFSAGPYSQHYHDPYMRMGDLGMSINGDTKQRKRRGNLPKETTDKLRAWFVAHLHHPYPTEDEKQDLMRQTGLQMNQISNWFINARRRQLPTMINNARAESDAMTARGVDGKVLPSTERTDYDGSAKGDGMQLSDGEGDGGSYDEADLRSSMRRRGASDFKRGSV